MDITHHLTASLEAAVALANYAGARHSRGREHAPAPGEAGPREVEAVLRLATDRVPAVDTAAFEALRAGGLRLHSALSHLIDGDEDGAAESVNCLLEAVRATPRLVRHDNAPWHLHFAAPADTGAARWLADLATAVALLLGSAEVSRLHRCAADRCDNLFLDGTRSRTRRFCSNACQNRTKVAAFRQQRAT